jgi:hypothetical protein
VRHFGDESRGGSLENLVWSHDAALQASITLVGSPFVDVHVDVHHVGLNGWGWFRGLLWEC